MNANVVESPLDIELGKDHGVFHVVNQFMDEGQGVCVADGMGVQILIILARMEQNVSHCDKEEGSSLRGFGRNDSSGLQIFVDESFTCFPFLQVKRIHLCDLWNERGLKINGMVI